MVSKDLTIVEGISYPDLIDFHPDIKVIKIFSKIINKAPA